VTVVREASGLVPRDGRLQALCHLWRENINRHIIPPFCRHLQAQKLKEQGQYAKDQMENLALLVTAADVADPIFFSG